MNDMRKSSYSHANNNGCVEVGSYRKSRRSQANGQCVEVGAGDEVGVRDTTQAGQANRTELEFPAGAWRTFLRQLKDGLG